MSQWTNTSETASDKAVDDCWHCGIKTSDVQHSWLIPAGQLEVAGCQSTHHQPEHTQNPGEHYAGNSDQYGENIKTWEDRALVINMQATAINKQRT